MSSASQTTSRSGRGGVAGGYRVGDADRNRTADLLKEAHAAGYLTLEEVTSGSAPRWAPAPAASWTDWWPTCGPSGGPGRNASGGRPGPLARQRPAGVGQSAMRRATAGRILEAWRAGQTVARTEAMAAAATSTVMLAQGMGKPTPEAFSSWSFLNSR
jgi:Domain of unknown function (DUF1707)